MRHQRGEGDIRKLSQLRTGNADLIEFPCTHQKKRNADSVGKNKRTLSVGRFILPSQTGLCDIYKSGPETGQNDCKKAALT